MKAVVAAFNQEKALVGAFSVIMNLWMELFQALVEIEEVTETRLIESSSLMEINGLNLHCHGSLPRPTEIIRYSMQNL